MIKVGEEITNILKRMVEYKIDDRPNLKSIVSQFMEYTKVKDYNSQIEICSYLEKKEEFIQPHYHDDLSGLKKILEEKKNKK